MTEYTITNANFEKEVLDSGIPVMLDFWASWCGPCRMLAPVVAELAAEYEGRIKVGKVNVDEEPELAGTFGVGSIPTLVFIKDSEVVDSIVGFRPKTAIAAQIEKLLG